MFAIIGLLLVLFCVFGGYIIAGGKIGIILKALPFEFLIIGGSAAGSFLVGNSGSVISHAIKDFGRVFSGPKYKREDYIDLLCLIFTILKLARSKGTLAVEPHIEKPDESNIFMAYPKVLANKYAILLICDHLRMLSMGGEDAHQLEEIFNKELEKHHHEVMRGSGALSTTADACPALGIVAAVMGVIKTMSSIDQPPIVLGGLIGSALVGTFLGVLLSYGILGPMANRLKQVYEDEFKFFEIIRDTFVAHLQGNAPQISTEIGRKSVPSELQPTFYELEEAIASKPAA